jgi:hypothetical protein
MFFDELLDPAVAKQLAAEFPRERYYLEHRTSAVPLLRNLGSDTPDTIAARIAERAKIVMPHAGVTRAAWRR